MKKRLFNITGFNAIRFLIFISILFLCTVIGGIQTVHASSLKYVGYYGGGYDCYTQAGGWTYNCVEHISEFAPYTNIINFGLTDTALAQKAKDNGMKVVLNVDLCFFINPALYWNLIYLEWDACKSAIDQFYNQGNLYAFYFDEPRWNAYIYANTPSEGWLTVTDSGMATTIAKLKWYYPDVRIMATEADLGYNYIYPGIDLYSVDTYGTSESYFTSRYDYLKSIYSGDIWVTAQSFDLNNANPPTVAMLQAWYNLAASSSRYSGLYWFMYTDATWGKGALNYPDVLAYNRQVGLSILCSNNWENNPVCGANGVNYANPDLAKCAGTTIANYGSCTTSPTISFTSPANGATISGTLSATTSPSTGVVNIKYYIDGSYLFDEQNAPYGFTLDTTAYANGAHILKAVAYNSAGYTGEASITVTFSNTLTCTSWTYSSWGTCSSSGTQTRTFLTSSPTGCTGGSPILSQSCTPTCTSWTYSAWGTCSSSGNQTRTFLTSSPTGCTGGSPILSQSCTYTPLCTESNWTYSLSPSVCPSNGLQTKTWTKTGSCSGGTSHPTSETVYCTPGVQTCTSWTYSAWGTCSSSGNQTRTFLTSSPTGCTGGSPILSQSCTPTCTSWTYSAWGTCSSSGNQTRTFLTSYPTGCTGGSPILSQSCTYTPLCTESNWTYSLSPSVCPSNGLQTKTWTKTGSCSGGTSHPTSETVYCTPGVQTCTSWTYSAWGTCSSLGNQTRTFLTSSPTGCTGGSPILSQSCTYTPLCTESNWTYSLSPSVCPSNGLQTKTWTKTGSCSGGTSHPTSETVYCTPGVQTCTSWTYSAWGTCSSSGNQTRTFLTSSPSGCTGGSPIISRSCGLCTESDWTYTLYPEICPPEGFQTKRWDKEGECSGGVHRPDPKRISCNPGVLTCVYFDYTGWSPCFSEIQTRTVISSFPEDCIGGDPKLSRSCCEGCDFSTKCYSVGYRLSSNYPKYCSENKEFVLQLESGSACNNNFECKSNLCSSGKCTYPGVFNKFIRWLKKLFS